MRLLASSMRKCAFGLAIGLLSFLTPVASTAQMAFSTDLAWPGLTRDDVERMHAAAARLYEGRSIGTVERWRNPDTKTAGEIKLVRSFEASGMSCRRLEYTVRFEIVRDAPREYILNWCRLPDGAWKIVELVPPAR
jgi:surface antigen